MTATDPNAPTSDAPPAYTGSQQSVQSPIGVPYYITDPSTGQPALIDPATGRSVTVSADGHKTYSDTGEPFNGQPVPLRWGASSPGTPDANAGHSAAEQSHAVAAAATYTLPRYFQGDEWLPAALPPDQVASLQKKMVSAGLLKPGEAQLGVWDVASMTAYQRLLAYANASGLDKADALDRWALQHAANPDSGGPNHPLVVNLTNPDDLRQTFRKAVIDTLGEGWDQTKIDQMVNAYQQVETQAQQSQYAMTGSGSPTDLGTGGTVTAPPSPQAYAAAQAQQENPTGAQEHDALGYINQFRQLVGGWQG